MSRVPAAYLALIGSARVSGRTRAALLERLGSNGSAHVPTFLSSVALETLRALVDRIVPQKAHDGPIDLAGRLEANLAAGVGDGWRFADLPDDRIAWQTGLAILADLGFSAMTAADQDALLVRMAAGKAPAASGWSATQQQHWFEDVRGETVRIYVAHPSTLARIGYSGIGYGGDEADKLGFHLIGPGERESWEPEPLGTTLTTATGDAP